MLKERGSSDFARIDLYWRLGKRPRQAPDIAGEGGSRNRPYENMRRAAAAGTAVAAALCRHSRVAMIEMMDAFRKMGINSIAATWACQALPLVPG